MEALPEVGGAWQALHVPAEVLAELDGRAAPVGLVLLRHVSVLERDAESLLDARIGTHRPALEQIARLVEDPRLPERAAGDHHPRAPRLALHADGVLGRL